jgi:hypothetical protein
MAPRVRPVAHTRGLLLIEQLEAHEESDDASTATSSGVQRRAEAS